MLNGRISIKVFLTPFLYMAVSVTSRLVTLSYVISMLHIIINIPVKANDAKKLMCSRILCCFLRDLKHNDKSNGPLWKLCLKTGYKYVKE